MILVFTQYTTHKQNLTFIAPVMFYLNQFIHDLKKRIIIIIKIIQKNKNIN
jgi:hypothetical protein